MKVFFTVDALINAGTEKSILDIVSNFTKEISATVVYFYPRHDLRHAYESAGVNIIFLDLGGKKNFSEGVKKLSALILKEKPDLVVSSILRANIISRKACKRTRTKLVGTFVSDSYSIERKKSFSLKRRIGAHIFYLIDKATSRIPIAWIANSESIKKSNCAHLHINPELVKVIYRGRDKRKFPEKVNKAGKLFRFVFVGRILETKGLTELVQAFELIEKSNSNILLDIYGDGPFRKLLTEKIATSNVAQKINLHGAVLDGWKKMYEADCFVFPSWYEGFSGSLIEAMMVGIPIIASDIPMNLEAVEHEITACVFKVKNVGALSKAMQHMIDSYENMIPMAVRARITAIDKFEIKNISLEYEGFLKSLVNSGIVHSLNDVNA